MQPTDAALPPPSTALPRWLPLLLLATLIVALTLGLEFAARAIAASDKDPILKRVVSDYGRLAVQGPDWIRFVPDPELGYRLRPGFELTSPLGAGVTRHNGDGFRALADFPPKSADVLRIACFGGSTTYGVSVEDNSESYPAQLELLLNGAYKPAGWSRVEVFNLGVGGYTSSEVLGTMKRWMPVLQPDVVLIQIAINDVVPRFYPDYKPDYSHFRTEFSPLEVTPLRRVLYRSNAWLTFAYGLGWIKPLSLQSQTQRPMPPVNEALANLEKNAPTGYVANLTEAVATAQRGGTAVWLLTEAYLDHPAFAGPNEASRRLEAGYRRGLAEHNALIIELARKTGGGLIQLHRDTPPDLWLFADPVHMTAAGNKVKAELVARALAPTLTRSTG